MKILWLSLLYCLTFSCTQGTLNGTKPTKENSDEEQHSVGTKLLQNNDQPSPLLQMVQLDIGGHNIVAHYKSEKVEQVSLPAEIFQSLQIRFFERMLAIYDVDRLREICNSMNYRSQRIQVLTKIQGFMQINPFSSEAIRKGMRSKFGDIKDDIPGALDKFDVKVEVSAPFLNEDEIANIEAKLMRDYQSSHPRVEFLLLGDLSRLENPSPLEPIMEFGRLICGILNNEAEISFVLTDENSRILRTIVNKIQM